MTDANYTAFCLIMDRSGSMESIQTEAENAINNFVEEQKKLPGKATLTLTQFDDTYEVLFANTPIAEVNKITLVPRGMTALNDAVARTVISFGESLAAMPEQERPAKVLVAIVTDGEENASQEWKSKAKIKALLTEQIDKWNWEIIYLGANVDAFAEGAAMGLRTNMSRGWTATAAGTKGMGQSLGKFSSSYRSTGTGDWGDNEPGDQT